MIESSLIIESGTGIHARPAGLIVREASKYKSSIILAKDGKEYNAKSVMSIMTMAADKGEQIFIKINGVDEEEAHKAIVNLIQTGLE